MKLQITNTRTGERSVVAGTDEQVEARLRLLYPGSTDDVPDGYLGNVIQAVARVQHIGIVSLDGTIPAPVHGLSE